MPSKVDYDENILYQLQRLEGQKADLQDKVIDFINKYVGNRTHRDIVKLRLQSASWRDIGETMGLKPSTVRVYHARAINRLRKFMEG